MKTLEELNELKAKFEHYLELQSAQVAYAFNVEMRAVTALNKLIKTNLCISQCEAWISELEDEQADEK